MKITKRQLRRIIREEFSEDLLHQEWQPGTDLVADVQSLVDDGVQLMSMDTQLKSLGYRDAKLTSAMNRYWIEVTFNGKPHMIISKSQVEPDASTQFAGNYALGQMESKSQDAGLEGSFARLWVGRHCSSGPTSMI